MKRYIKSAVSDISNEDFEVQQEIAVTTDDVETILQLYKNRNNHSEVARNPNTPIEILRKLARETPASNTGYSTSVFDNLAWNPNSPSDVLSEISHKCDWHTLGIIIKHPNVSYATLKLISKSDKVSKATRKLAKEMMQNKI